MPEKARKNIEKFLDSYRENIGTARWQYAMLRIGEDIEGIEKCIHFVKETGYDFYVDIPTFEGIIFCSNEFFCNRPFTLVRRSSSRWGFLFRRKMACFFKSYDLFADALLAAKNMKSKK